MASTTPPPTPPAGPPAPPPPAPPAPPAVPPAAPMAAPPPGAPVAPKKTSPLVWVLVGCGALLVLAAMIMLVSSLFLARACGRLAKQAEKNPAVFAAKMMAAANPDVEVVSSDDDRGTVTLRNKKTGEEITVDAEDIKKGRLRFKNEKSGEEVTFEGKAEEGGEKGSFRVKSKEGEMTFGTGGEQAPSWVPSYAGAEPQGMYSSKTGEGFAGAYSFETGDSPSEVMSFYEEELKGAGFEVTTSSFKSGKKTGGWVHGQDQGAGRSVQVAVESEEGATKVVVNYQQGK
jgi:hypothetical protein